MSITLRSEQPGDEAGIDIVNSLAFKQVSEGNIVRLMRQHNPAYDPRFSITAWDGDRMIGHALFSPARVRLLGETVRALAVGPVGVATDRQRQGIGGMLMERGHDLGRREGYLFAFLCGHPTYYPRLGYKPAFGVPETRIDSVKLPQPQRKFDILPVQPDDLRWLVERLEAEMADVDFAWIWGRSIGEWSMTNVNAMIWWTEGRRAAYTVAPHGRGRCDLLLADDLELAREVLATLRPSTLRFHHPDGWLAREALVEGWATSAVNAHDAAMARELQPGALKSCLEAVSSGRPLGAVNWALPFIAC